jgi:hypothetical protein
MPTHSTSLPEDLRALLALVEHKCYTDLRGIRIKIAEYRWRVAAHAAWGNSITVRRRVCSWDIQIYLLNLEYLAAQHKAIRMLEALRFLAL